MSKSGFLLSATIYLGELQGQSQKTSLVSLSWDYNNADQTRMKFLKNSLGRVWAHQLRKPVQKSLPNWQEPEILLALVPEVTSCPEARSAGVTKEIYLWLSFLVAAEFYINQTFKFTHAISIGFSEAGVCFCGGTSTKLFWDSFARYLRRNYIIGFGFFFPIRHADFYISSVGQESSEILKLQES